MCTCYVSDLSACVFVEHQAGREASSAWEGVDGWGEAELEQFLPVLARMPKLKRLGLSSSPISALAELR